jgi:putative heme-binding domain-containing protein
LTLAGDQQRGFEVFRRACATCHQLAGIGQAVGPDLASLGDKAPETLLIAILDPNRAVEARYVNYLAMTKNGQSLTGILASETGNSITLVASDGKKHAIPRNDLEELVSTNKSLMPEGLEKDLKAQDLADVIAYIRSGEPPLTRKTFPGNRPEVVKPAADGSLHLLPGNCEIYGPSLVLEEKYGNLGFWTTEADRAVWSIDVPRAGKFTVWFDWACHDKSAGKTFLLEAGLTRLTGAVQGTGDWDTYRQAKIGKVSLNAGPQKIIFRSAGRITSAMIDLRGIRLATAAP